MDVLPKLEQVEACWKLIEKVPFKYNLLRYFGNLCFFIL